MSTLQINDVEPVIEYSAAASQDTFPYPFEIFEDSDLVVSQNSTELTLTTDYTVTNAGVTGGGDVVLVTPATVNDVIVISREVPAERLTNFQTGGELRSSVLNAELQRIIAILQQNERNIGSAFFPDPVTSTIDLDSNRLTTGVSAVAGSDIPTLSQVNTLISAAELDPVSPTLYATQDEFGGGLITAGTGDNYTLTPSESLGAYAGGVAYVAQIDRANSGATTLNVSGLGAKSVYGMDAVALSGGELVADSAVLFVYSVALGGFVALGPRLDPPSLDASVIDSGTIAVARLPAATDIAAGIQENATDAEGITGTATDRTMTPASVRAVNDDDYDSNFFESAEQTITINTNTSVAHGFASIPKLVQVVLVCKTADLGFSVDDEIVVPTVFAQTLVNRGVTITADSTNIKMTVGAGIAVGQYQATIGNAAEITLASWKLVARAWLK